MDAKQPEKRDLGGILKYLLAIKNKSIFELSEEKKIPIGTIYSWTSKNNMSLADFVMIMNHCGEKCIIEMSNGDKFELEGNAEYTRNKAK